MKICVVVTANIVKITNSNLIYFVRKSHHKIAMSRHRLPVVYSNVINLASMAVFLNHCMSLFLCIFRISMFI